MGNTSTDPWENTKIREKPILDELLEFSKWYEGIYKEHCDNQQIPEEMRQVLEMSKEVQEAKAREKASNEALGIECGSLTEAKLKQEAEREKTFAYQPLVREKPEVWYEILSFFGIDHAFPSENLYEHTVGQSKNIVLLNSGLHEFMQHKKKFKFDVVNLGLNIFQKN